MIIFNHDYIPPTVHRTTARYVAYVDAFAPQRVHRVQARLPPAGLAAQRGGRSAPTVRPMTPSTSSMR